LNQLISRIVNQSKNIFVFWGYSLFPDLMGDFVKKPMTECTGEEILIELFHHLKHGEQVQHIIDAANCIHRMMALITSQFMPRLKGDLPDVVPVGEKNFAFIG